MNCWKIQFIDTFTMPDHFFASGRLYLDIDDQTEIKLSKVTNELNDLNNITTDFVIPFTVPRTPKNYMLFKNRVQPNTYAPDYTGIKVFVSAEGVKVDGVELFVISIEEDRINLELRNGEDHWASKASRLYLNQIDFGTFLLDWSTLEDQWDQVNWDETDPTHEMFQFPLVNYGKFVLGERPHPSDFRPFIFVLAALQQGFCDIGWIFECPILESTVGRKWIAYLNRADYANDELLKRDREFKVETTQVYDDDDNGEQINFTTEIYDIGDHFSLVIDEYRGTGDMVFHLEGELVLSIVPFYAYRSRLIIYIQYADGTVTNLADQEYELQGAIGIGESNAFPIDIETPQVTVSHGDKVFCYYEELQNEGAYSGSLTETFDLTFYNEVNKTIYTTGDNINIANEIDPDLTLLDLLKGVIHLFNGKADTEWNEKKVTFYPDWFSVYEGQNMAAYYRAATGTIHDLRDKQIYNSELITNPNDERSRFMRLQFGKANDEAVKNLDLPENSPLYSREIDFGEEYLNKVEKRENPLFEPTLNKAVQFKLVDGTVVDNDCPHLLDNDDGENSFKIGARIAIYNGESAGVAKKIDDSTRITCQFNWYGSDVATIPHASQFTEFVDSVGDDLPHLIYGEAEYDLYNTFWKSSIYQSLLKQSIDLLVNLRPSDIKRFSPRDVYQMTVLGRPVFARLKEIRDFDACVNRITPLSFFPHTPSDSLCIEAEFPAECANSPTITVNQVGDTYNITTGGTFEETPDTITIEYRGASEASWTTGSSIVEPTELTYVRAIFDYPTCPQQIIQTTVNGCANDPVLVFTFDAATDTVTISIGGENASTFDEALTEITYAIDGGGDVTVAGSSVSGLSFTTQICASASVVYQGYCPNIALTQTCFDYPAANELCDQNSIEIQTQLVAPNMYIIERINQVLATTPDIDIIKYRPVGGSTWFFWDGYTPLTSPFEAQQVVTFPANTCDQISSSIITQL